MWLLCVDVTVLRVCGVALVCLRCCVLLFVFVCGCCGVVFVSRCVCYELFRFVSLLWYDVLLFGVHCGVCSDGVVVFVVWCLCLSWCVLFRSVAFRFGVYCCCVLLCHCLCCCCVCCVCVVRVCCVYGVVVVFYGIRVLSLRCDGQCRVGGLRCVACIVCVILVCCDVVFVVVCIAMCFVVLLYYVVAFGGFRCCGVLLLWFEVLCCVICLLSCGVCVLICVVCVVWCVVVGLVWLAWCCVVWAGFVECCLLWYVVRCCYVLLCGCLFGV